MKNCFTLLFIANVKQRNELCWKFFLYPCICVALFKLMNSRFSWYSICSWPVLCDVLEKAYNARYHNCFPQLIPFRRVLFKIMCLLFVFLQSLDFLGRVKDKAGNFEKQIKEKDRHGNLYKFYSVFTNCSAMALPQNTCGLRKF